MIRRTAPLLIVILALFNAPKAQVAIHGETVYTSAGEPVTNGVVLVRDGRIERIGPATQISIPEGYEVLRAQVVTPGLIDAHTVVGLSGYLNQPHDQDQLERSSPIQPELRAIDAYNPRERLVEWVRSFGITTIHTGHGPGKLISGQTMVAKTYGSSVQDAVIVGEAMVAATLDSSGREQGRSPGTSAKMIAMLRNEFLAAQNYLDKQEDDGSVSARDLRREVLARILKKELPLLVTVHRSHGILAALRLAGEFDIRLVLDGAAEAYLVLDEIKSAGVPVLIHPAMQRARGETENLSMETAAKLSEAGIPFAFQSGFEGYVPKTRVVLFEAAVAAANGLGGVRALEALTIDAARLLGVDDRVGSIEPGKDADLVLFDGDPFEYTSHVLKVFINGRAVSDGDSEWR